MADFLPHVLIITVFLGYSKLDSILNYLKESKYEEYAKILESQKNKNFTQIAIEQAQILHTQSKADFTAIHAFKPEELNYFSEIIAMQGKAPSFIDSRLTNGEGRPIDKTANQYTTHLAGYPFTSGDEFIFLSSEKDINNEIHYMYSCPYYNLANIYSGNIEFYYSELPPEYDEKRLFGICDFTSRVLGRTR